MEAELEIVAVINSNTTKKADALNHLVEGLDSGTLKGLNVSAIRVLGKQADWSSVAYHDSCSAAS